MTTGGNGVVIIGAGIAGIATAYFLGKAGVECLVIDKDSVASHASGFAHGGVSSLSGEGPSAPLFPVANEGMRIYRELAHSLSKDTGVNTEYRIRPCLALAFSEEERETAKANLARQQQQEGYTVRWVETAEARAIEPRVSDKVLGAVYIEGTGDVESYRFVLALAQAAEKLGATILHGRVSGLKREGDRVSGVILESGEIPCDQAVFAMGPWSGEAASWLGVPIPVTPLKGQILRLRVAGAPLRCPTIRWSGNYATAKPDGLVWAGTTHEEVGFDETPTSGGRDEIMASLVKMVPSMVDAQLVRQTACLRPLSSDGLLLLGPVPGWQGVYMATGAGGSGIVLGPAMGRITADLLVKGASDIQIDAFDPGRFSG